MINNLPINNPVVIGIVGGMGSGKTLTATAISYLLKNQYKIITNYNLNHADFVYKNLDNLMKFQKKLQNLDCKKLVIHDEIHVFNDSRNAMSNRNMLFSYILTQFRKMKVTFLYTTQYLNQVDIRIRNNTDVILQPVYIEEIDVLKVKYYVRKSFGEIGFTHKHTKIFKNLEPIFETYNTNELIGVDNVEKLGEKMKINSN